MNTKTSILAKPTLSKNQTAVTFAEAGRPKKPTSTQVSSNGKRNHYAPEGFGRLVANVPQAMLKQLKHEAVERECTVTDIVIEALSARGYGEAKSN